MDRPVQLHTLLKLTSHRICDYIRAGICGQRRGIYWRIRRSDTNHDGNPYSSSFTFTLSLYRPACLLTMTNHGKGFGYPGGCLRANGGCMTLPRAGRNSRSSKFFKAKSYDAVVTDAQSTVLFQ